MRTPRWARLGSTAPRHAKTHNRTNPHHGAKARTPHSSFRRLIATPPVSSPILSRRHARRPAGPRSRRRRWNRPQWSPVPTAASSVQSRGLMRLQILWLNRRGSMEATVEDPSNRRHQEHQGPAEAFQDRVPAVAYPKAEDQGGADDPRDGDGGDGDGVSTLRATQPERAPVHGGPAVGWGAHARPSCARTLRANTCAGGPAPADRSSRQS